MPVIYHPAAEREVIDAAQWYERHEAGVGADYLDAVDAAVQLISDNPVNQPAVEDEVRRCPVRRFPYSIYFRISVDSIRILAVAHASRDPLYWRDRN
jgi:toxin ParE1/3/4